MELAGVNLLDPQLHRMGPPYAVLARLRREAPVFLHRRSGMPPFWMLTRHADVAAVAADWEGFSSAANGALLEEEPTGPADALHTSLLHLDPPEHAVLRGAVGAGFTAEATERLTVRLRTLCTLVLDRVCERGGCDFVEDVAAEFSLLPLAEMLGFPDAADRRRVHRLARTLSDPLERLDPDAVMRATMGLFDVARELRQQSPEGGLAELTGRQFELFFLLLATAGHMTAQQLMSGALLALFEDPDAWRRLTAEPELPGTAVDELVRFVSPVMTFQRTATADTEIGGQAIAKGDRVALCYAAANRDESVFADPDRLDLERDPNPHLGFGLGPHHCLGDGLARLQTRVLFEELARRMPDIEPAGPVDRLGSTFLNGIRSLPVRFTPSPPVRRRARG
ncbi:cytochrome P450 [Streptomyces sp. NPDC021020]|uniref:cytochrome P450 n=1 Tax=Streptomyces sp. NPDC021020 TaxID=3365109 RepID=UPI0037B5E393